VDFRPWSVDEYPGSFEPITYLLLRLRVFKKINKKEWSTFESTLIKLVETSDYPIVAF